MCVFLRLAKHIETRKLADSRLSRPTASTKGCFGLCVFFAAFVFFGGFGVFKSPCRV